MLTIITQAAYGRFFIACNLYNSAKRHRNGASQNFMDVSSNRDIRKTRAYISNRRRLFRMAKYRVEIKKKDGVQHEGVMAIKEPQVINGLYAIADENGGWLYIQRDEVSEIRFTPVTDEVKEETKEPETKLVDETKSETEEKQPEGVDANGEDQGASSD